MGRAAFGGTVVCIPEFTGLDTPPKLDLLGIQKYHASHTCDGS